MVLSAPLAHAACWQQWIDRDTMMIPKVATPGGLTHLQLWLQMQRYVWAPKVLCNLFGCGGVVHVGSGCFDSNQVLLVVAAHTLLAVVFTLCQGVTLCALIKLCWPYHYH